MKNKDFNYARTIVTKFFCTMLLLMTTTSLSAQIDITRLKSDAKRGVAVAQCALGGYYLKGDGVTKNYAEAVKWFKKAAEQGSADAQFFLGFCYMAGWGVEMDFVESVGWLKKAAKQGHQQAASLLKDLYSIP